MLLYPFAIAILYFYPDNTHQFITSDSWGLICFGVSFLGLVVRAMTVGFTPKGTSGRNTDAGQVAEKLNQTGIYSVVRHPLYLGNFLMWLGLFMYIGFWWFVLICALAYWLYYERIMYAEEEFLRRSSRPATKPGPAARRLSCPASPAGCPPTWISPSATGSSGSTTACSPP